MKLRLSPTDQELEREGVWTEFCGVELKIARRNSPAFVEAMTPPDDDEEDTADRKRERMLRAMSQHLLVDWRGWTQPTEDGDGERTIKYSSENAYELLVNDYDAREFVSRFSMTKENYIRKRAEDTAGN